MLTCELSGQVVVHPVITSCHHVFERKLIEDYISNSGSCPKCNSPLTTQDLYDINITPLDTYPATIRAPSFSSLLSSLQNEWDSVQEELFNLRSKLASTQRELAQALYENDAAKRVIARLLSEKGIAIPTNIANASIPQNQNSGAKQQSNLATYFRKEAKIISKRNKGKESQYANDSISIFNAFTQFGISRQERILNGESTLSAIDRYPHSEILIGADNGLVLGIDPRHGMSHEYASFDNRVVSIASNARYTHFIAADRNGNIKICAIASEVNNNNSSNLALNEIRISTQRPISSALFHPKEEHVIVCYEDGVIEIFVINDSNPEHSSLDSFLTFDTEVPITMAEIHSDGLYIVTANNSSNKLYVFDVANKRLASEFYMPSEITAIALPRNNSRFMAAGCSSCARIWDLTTLATVAEIPINCTNLAFDSTGFIIAIITEDGTQCKFVRLNESGQVDSETHSIDINNSSKIGKFSSNGNYFAMIGDHDCINFISSQE